MYWCNSFEFLKIILFVLIFYYTILFKLYCKIKFLFKVIFEIIIFKNYKKLQKGK